MRYELVCGEFRCKISFCAVFISSRLPYVDLYSSAAPRLNTKWYKEPSSHPSRILKRDVYELKKSVPPAASHGQPHSVHIFESRL